jgi:hypothetical protein
LQYPKENWNFSCAMSDSVKFANYCFSQTSLEVIPASTKSCVERAILNKNQINKKIVGIKKFSNWSWNNSFSMLIIFSGKRPCVSNQYVFLCRLFQGCQRTGGGPEDPGLNVGLVGWNFLVREN